MKSVCVFTNNKNKFNKLYLTNRIDINYLDYSELDNNIFLNYVDLILVDTAYNNISAFIKKLQQTTQLPYILIISKKTNNTITDSYYFDIIYTDDDLSELGIYLINYFNKQSDLAEFDIVDIMQMISMEQKTILLKIATEKETGFISFLNGVPFHVIYNKVNKSLEGKKAFTEIVNKKHNYFKLYPYKANLQQNLEGNLTSLLMDAMCFIDEDLNQSNYHNEKSKQINFDDCIDQFSRVRGFLGYGIFNNNCDCIDLKVNFNEINQNKDFGDILLKMYNLVSKIGFGKLSYIELESEKCFLLIQYSFEKKVNIMLFLEKTGNIPIAKIVLQKTINNF